MISFFRGDVSGWKSVVFRRRDGFLKTRMLLGAFDFWGKSQTKIHINFACGAVLAQTARHTAEIDVPKLRKVLHVWA